MCGIAGYYGTQDLGDKVLKSCLSLMQKRGPDAQVFRKLSTGKKKLVLLHSRLSIIDLDVRSNQPFHLGRKWLSYNGELYNYRELKESYKLRGANFITASDTEVFLTALDIDGLEALDRFEGMWAFAMYDDVDQSLTLCRDRFGEKPLYVLRTKDGIYFASEIKFIFSLLGRRPQVNYQHLMRYLVNGYKSLYKNEDNFFKEVFEVPPGSWLKIDADGEETRQSFWNPKFLPDETMSYDDAVIEVKDRLIRSVELRLRGDVPLAFLMSGGVDSNALVSIARKILDYDVHGFTIMNKDERYDEGEIVLAAARELDIRHTPIDITTTGFLPQLSNLIDYHDAPVSTITYYIQWTLMRRVAESGYHISISGTGADELFSGYYDHFLMHLAELKNGADYTQALTIWNEQIRPLVRNPYLSNPDLFIKNPNFRDHIYLNNDIFSSFLVDDFYEEFSETSYCADLMRNRMMNEMFHEAVRVILHEDDLNAMYFSIENRSPFLDRNLFEFCYTIPTRHLIRNGYNKSILRDAVRGIAPDHVINERRKIGFNAPVESFLDLDNPDIRKEMLNDSPIFRHIKRDKILGLLSKRNLPNSESKFLFYFLNAKIFLEKFDT